MLLYIDGAIKHSVKIITEAKKMKFVITMNMSAHSGKPVHQVVLDHPSLSIEDFCDHVNECEFIVGDEYYCNRDTQKYYLHGRCIINTGVIGKIAEYRDTSRD